MILAPEITCDQSKPQQTSTETYMLIYVHSKNKKKGLPWHHTSEMSGQSYFAMHIQFGI